MSEDRTNELKEGFYTVEVHIRGIETYYVKAGNEGEAIKKARNEEYIEKVLDITSTGFDYPYYVQCCLK